MKERVKERYHCMYEHIHAGENLIDKTIEAAIAQPERRRIRAWKLIPALAVLLALLVATPALAAGVPAFNDLIYQLSPEVAMYFRPVNRSAADQGITVSVVAVDMEKDSAVMYIAVQGEGVNESTELYDNYHFNEGANALRIATKAGYDPETSTAVFRVLYTQGHGDLGDGQKATFTLKRILLNRTNTVRQAEGFVVEDVQGEAIVLEKGFQRSVMPDIQESPREVLKPGSLDIPLADGVSISAAGLVNGRYRVQIRNDRQEMYGDLRIALMRPEWEAYRGQDLSFGPIIEQGRIAPGSDEYWMRHFGSSEMGYVSFEGEDGALYTDYIFSGFIQNMTGDHVFVQLTETVEAVDGNWSITFPLEDYQQSEM